MVVLHTPDLLRVGSFSHFIECLYITRTPCLFPTPRPHPAMSPDRQFPKSIDSLEQIFTFLEETLTPMNAGPHVRQTLAFATEEFFTNCIKYNRTSRSDILIRIRKDGTTVRIEIIDTGVDAFDVTQAPPPDLQAAADSRRVGGLGIHLSRELLDGLAYTYADKTSTITMTMNLQG